MKVVVAGADRHPGAAVQHDERQKWAAGPSRAFSDF
jgi:hypothetical protein